jgi:hypothetical protein
MSSDDGPHKTREEIIKFVTDVTKPIVEPFVQNKEKIEFYLDTAYHHSKRVSPLISTKWQKLEQNTSQFLIPYHHYRRQLPWEIITASSAAVFIASLPYGIQATSRNAFMTACFATLLVCPEYAYDKYKFYTSGGVKASQDNSNKSTFRW